jgi:5-methylcytosine-specific restriction endonuclease McrA
MIEDMAKYKREWLARRRQVFILSRGAICAKCLAINVPFDIDHIDRTLKQHKISSIWSLRAEVREAELAKCQLLCKPCHKLKTSAELRKDLRHGMLGMYKTRRCRCEDCRNANRIAKADRLRRQRERNERLA